MWRGFIKDICHFSLIHVYTILSYGNLFGVNIKLHVYKKRIFYYIYE